MLDKELVRRTADHLNTEAEEYLTRYQMQRDRRHRSARALYEHYVSLFQLASKLRWLIDEDGRKRA